MPIKFKKNAQLLRKQVIHTSKASFYQILIKHSIKNAKYIRYNERIIRFLIVGFSAAIVNFLIITFFIEILGFKTYFLKNLANILGIEISAIYNFFVSRLWTWKDAPRKHGKRLIPHFMFFNLALLSGITIRVILFAVLEKWGIFYLLNVTFGIGIAASIDFILYDKWVFRRDGHQKELPNKYGNPDSL